MSIPKIMIAAPKSGSGKTLITCSLLGALKKKNIDVVSFKCGPDYIDPMFHRTVISIPSENLDTYFTGRKKTREILEEFSCGHEMAVMEGVMGLYDGAGGVSFTGSSYELACVTKTPVILVVDAHGMGRSIVPVISGMLSYDKYKLIKGVILNRVSKGFYGVLADIIRKEIDIEVLGFFENRSELDISSRHLGLTLPNEIEDIKSRLSLGADCLLQTVDLERIIEISKKYAKDGTKASGNSYNINAAADESLSADKQKEVCKDDHKKIKLAVARDEAFCFYYEANLRMFEERGIGIEFFSPIHDKNLPDDCSGILLGGGYPELYADKLSCNKSMLLSVKEAVSNGMPSLAECGGFMYLHKEIEDEKGKIYPLADVINEKVWYTGKPVRFGYIEVTDKTGEFLSEDKKIKGHEFHYYDSTGNGSDAYCEKPVSGKEWDGCYVNENHWWGFPHFYYPSCPEFVEKFVDIMAEYAFNKREK